MSDTELLKDLVERVENLEMALLGGRERVAREAARMREIEAEVNEVLQQAKARGALQ
jgi:hypothetical protein